MKESCFSFERLATPAASIALEQFDEPSRVDDTIPNIGWDDLQTVSLLGTGAASNVYLVCTHDLSGNDRSHRLQQYALKCLNSERLSSSEDFVAAASDLAMEASLLSKLKHKNIVQLCGVSKTCLSDSYADHGKGYFILTNVLESTLKDRIQHWKRDTTSKKKKGLMRLSKIVKKFKRTTQSLSSSFRGEDSNRSIHLTSSTPPKKVTVIHGRIETVVMGIAEGIQYLHSQNIVIKDLKPENIGFDERAVVRLLDFGMSRYVSGNPEDLAVDSSEDSGNMVGTPRYMAPEVMRGQSCGLYSDIYSFGVLLWEICTTETPYESELKHIKPKKHGKESEPTTLLDNFVSKVANEGVRPSLDKIPCPGTRQLIQACWDEDITKRPTIDQVCTALVEIVNGQCADDSTPLSIFKRSIQDDLERLPTVEHPKGKDGTCSTYTSMTTGSCNSDVQMFDDPLAIRV